MSKKTVKAFVCNECGESFYSQDELNQHIKKSHEIIWEKNKSKLLGIEKSDFDTRI